MQNLDFTTRINRRTGGGVQGKAGVSESSGKGGSGVAARMNRMIIIVLALVLLAFSAGLFLGFRVGHYRQIEEDIVHRAEHNSHRSGDNSTVMESGKPSAGESRAEEGGKNSAAAPAPAPTPGEGESFSNTSERSSAAESVRDYVILLGAFSPRNAARLLIRLAGVPELKHLQPATCRSLDESVPGRKLGFRIAHPKNPDIHRVFLGCFHNRERAERVFKIVSGISDLGIPGVRLIELD